MEIDFSVHSAETRGELAKAHLRFLGDNFAVLPKVDRCAVHARGLARYLGGAPWLMAMLLCGAGLRLMECCRLRIKDIDVSQNQILVRAGKGDKDRHTMLPAAIKQPLLRHLEAVRRQTRPGSGKEFGPRSVAERLGEKISKRGERVGLAMGIPGPPAIFKTG